MQLKPLNSKKRENYHLVKLNEDYQYHPIKLSGIYQPITLLNLAGISSQHLQPTFTANIYSQPLQPTFTANLTNKHQSPGHTLTKVQCNIAEKNKQ